MKKGQGIEVLNDVLPRECREAHRADLLYIHNLGRFFDPEVTLIDLALESALAPANLGAAERFPLRLFRHLLRAANRASDVCVPHFDEDVGSLLSLEPSKAKEVLREVFSMLHEFSPDTTLTLNVGASFSATARYVTELVLDILDEGPTLTQPFVVMRVRKGLNLFEKDPHHDLLRRALDMSRHRQGFAFALMDSALNSQWLDAVTYTAKGLRIEPMAGDFLMGAKGHHVVGTVSINMPLLIGESDGEIERVMKLAARVLAQRQELVSVESKTVLGSQVINLAGLSACYPEDPLAAFALLEKLSTFAARLRLEYGVEYALAATSESGFGWHDDQSKRKESFAFEAEQQHILKGGHCLICPAALHLSVAQLHSVMLDASRAGVSFLRYDVDDIRCLECHTAVAAMGPCPVCGCVERREVLYQKGTLVGGIRREDYPEQTPLEL